MYVHTLVLPDGHTFVHCTLPFEAVKLLAGVRVPEHCFVVILPDVPFLEYAAVLREIVHYQKRAGRRHCFFLQLAASSTVCGEKQWQQVVNNLPTRDIRAGMFRLAGCWCKLLTLDRETGLQQEQRELLEQWF
jgi:hypothetical protein